MANGDDGEEDEKGVLLEPLSSDDDISDDGDKDGDHEEDSDLEEILCQLQTDDDDDNDSPVMWGEYFRYNDDQEDIAVVMIHVLR